jgi:hypothetical protein
MTPPNGRRSEAASPASRSDKTETQYVRTTPAVKKFIHSFASMNDLTLADAAEEVWLAGRDALRAAPPEGRRVPKVPGPKKRERLA